MQAWLVHTTLYFCNTWCVQAWLVHFTLYFCNTLCAGTPVLVHGAEGTDTTLLVTSLAQLILDKDCRTVSG